MEIAVRIGKLGRDIGLHNILIAGNKLRGQVDREFLLSGLTGFSFLNFVPYDQALIEGEVAHCPVLDFSLPSVAAVRGIYQALLSGYQTPGTTT